MRFYVEANSGNEWKQGCTLVEGLGMRFMTFSSCGGWHWMVALCLTFVAIATMSSRADDWPQWLGPQRDSVWREDHVLDKFPDGGPKVRWRSPVGGGYAGP